MPAVSQDQATAMNMAKAIQHGDLAPKPGTASAQIASSMKPSDLDEFAGTPQEGLPKKVKKPREAKWNGQAVKHFKG